MRRMFVSEGFVWFQSCMVWCWVELYWNIRILSTSDHTSKKSTCAVFLLLHLLHAEHQQVGSIFEVVLWHSHNVHVGSICAVSTPRICVKDDATRRGKRKPCDIFYTEWRLSTISSTMQGRLHTNSVSIWINDIWTLECRNHRLFLFERRRRRGDEGQSKEMFLYCSVSYEISGMDS